MKENVFFIVEAIVCLLVGAIFGLTNVLVLILGAGIIFGAIHLNKIKEKKNDKNN